MHLFLDALLWGDICIKLFKPTYYIFSITCLPDIAPWGMTFAIWLFAELKVTVHSFWINGRPCYIPWFNHMIYIFFFSQLLINNDLWFNSINNFFKFTVSINFHNYVSSMLLITLILSCDQKVQSIVRFPISTET